MPAKIIRKLLWYVLLNYLFDICVITLQKHFVYR